MKTAEHTKPSQCERVLAYLKANPNGLTSRECSRKLNIDRLAARVFELEAEGVAISKTRVRTKGGASVTRYRLG